MKLKNIIMIEYTFLCNTGLLRKKLESFGGGDTYISLNWGSMLTRPVIRLIANVDLRNHSQLSAMTMQGAGRIQSAGVVPYPCSSSLVNPRFVKTI